MRADAESSCPESRTDSWSQDGARNPWPAPTTELWAGNTGTYAGASRSTHTQLHLHWELHIDGHYLGVGLSDADTRAVYTALFADVSG